MPVDIIVKNIKFSIVNKAANILYSFIFFPFIIHYVGKEVYGLYLLVLTMIGYLSLLDMGVASAVVKYSAEYSGSGDKEKMSSVINFSLTFFIAIAVIICAALFTLSFCFDFFFKVSAPNQEIVKRLFWVAGLTALVYWPSLLFKNVLMGLQRYEWTSVGDIILVAVNAAAAYILFPRGGTIVDFQLVALFAAVFILGLYFMKMRTMVKGFKVRFPYFNKEISGLIFKYSIFMFLGGIVGTLIFQFGHIIVGVFVSLSALTIYGVAFSMQQNIRSVNSVISSPFTPALAELHGKNDLEAQRTLFFRGTKFSTAIFFPIVIIAIIFSRQFIINWMGVSFSDSVLPSQILLSFWFFSGGLSVGESVLLGKGVVNVFLWTSVICVVFTASLSLVLVKMIGITGAALGITLPMIFISFPIILYFVLKTLGISIGEFYGKTIKDNLVFYAIVVISALMLNAKCVTSNVYLTILEMSALYLLCMAFYYFILLSKIDRAAISELLKRNLRPKWPH